jgi:hypothetical protein
MFPCCVQGGRQIFHGTTFSREPFPNGCIGSLAIRHRAWDLRSTPSSEDERCDGIEEGRNFIDPDMRREWV